MLQGENSKSASHREDAYRLESVGRACSLLKAFADNEEKLSLVDLVSRTALGKTVAFRLLRTLEAEGLIRKAGHHQYCLNIRILGKKAFRIGHAAEGPASPFAVAVSDSLRWAAARNDIDLVYLDNRNSAKTVIRNAERLVAERVDLAIEAQEYAKIAPTISALFHDAGIPLIAVGLPHPGAVFYGIDNYRVGRAAGRALLKWAKQNWQGQADELLLLGEDSSGSLPRLRLSGIEDLIRQAMPNLGHVQYVDTRGKFPFSFDVVRRYLRFTKARRTLMVGINDEAVLGGLQAFEQSGRSEFCAAVALGGSAQARLELRMPATSLVACIAFFPERYGENLIRLALEMLHKRPVPPVVHPEPQIISLGNVNQFYPADNLELGRDFGPW